MLAVKESLNLIHRNVSAIRALLPAIRCLVKRRDLYVSTEKQLGCSVAALNMDTRWSSTFNMIYKAQKFKPIQNLITTRLHELQKSAVTDDDLHASLTVGNVFAKRRISN